VPYREKVAWLSLIAMATVFLPYFMWTKMYPPVGALPNLRQLALYAAACAVWGLILGIGHWRLRRLAPEEARLPLDERDRTIRYRARNLAYFVLLTGMILVGVIMPFTDGGWKIVNAALFMIVLAESVNDASVIFHYRRQS
jgi:membrane protease YdiL (CAAX protease family)